MPTQHPISTNHMIYWGTNGELPVAGHFYAVKKGDTLSWIARQACGDSTAWKNINRNIANKGSLYYRALSTSCSSSRVDSSLADKTLNPSLPGAYIALCQADARDWDKQQGSSYPIIWVPLGCASTTAITNVPTIKTLPTPAPAPTPTPSKSITALPVISNIPLYMPSKVSTVSVSSTFISPVLPSSAKPTAPVQITIPPSLSTGGSPTVQPTHYPSEDEGWPWWIWLLIAAGITTTGAVIYKKSKKGKRRKGKR